MTTTRIGIIAWALCECLFYIQFISNKNRLQKINKPKRPLTKQERTKIYYECLYTIQDIQSWAEGWFYYPHDRSHPAFKEIKRGNLALWLAWAFWHEHLDIVQQNPQWRDEIEWMLTTAESKFNMIFPPGFNQQLRCIRLHLDPVQATHRPLLIYVLIYIITLLFNLIFLQSLWGFTLHTTQGNRLDPLFFPNRQPSKHITYWSRHRTAQTQPVVFIHGVGVGLLGYAEFIHRLLLQFNDRPVFLIELPYVSMRLVDDVPSAIETVEGVREMLTGHRPAVFVSHSLGTAVTSWVARFAPHLMANAVMIDPICFLLHYPHVAFNFIHRLPKTLLEYFLCYGISRELYISHFISRHLQWFEAIQFGDQLKNTSIFLSERDRIISTLLVHTYLKERKADVHLMPHLEHAQFLMDSKWKRTILKHIDDIISK